MITRLIAAVRRTIADHRRYARVVAAMERLTAQDLFDLGPGSSGGRRPARDLFGE